MSTKIRPIKCPNCGSEKHVQLGDKLYRCKSCGTEYFLDDDDITVHVKHHFDNGGFSSFNGNSNVSITSIAKVFAIIGVITFFLLFMIIYGLRSSSPSVSSRDSISVEDTYRAIVPVRYNGRVCFFYLTNRSFSNWYSDDETPPTGYYYGFIDPDSGKVLADKLFISDDNARKIGMTAFHMLEIQYLNQVKKWKAVIPIFLASSSLMKSLSANTFPLSGSIKP